MRFLKAGDIIIPVVSVESVDISMIETGYVDVFYEGGKTARAHGFDAFEIVMQLRPAAIEGRRLQWAKNAWAFHNLIAHPLMQILVWFGFKKLAIHLHDATVPRPLSVRQQVKSL